jgi:gp16 family phage-associated protein
MNQKVDVTVKKIKRIKTIDDFRVEGATVAVWARERNFSPRLVYAVLRGERKCLRGESHKIAKELGMK